MGLVCVVTGDDDGQAPVLLVEVTGSVVGDFTAGFAVAGSGAGGDVQDGLGDVGVEYQVAGQALGGASTFENEVLGGG